MRPKARQTAARRPEGKPGTRPAPKSKQTRKDQEMRRWLRRKNKAKSPPSP